MRGHIQTANERRLGEIISTGNPGQLHTGRSRNDQVGTGMRLWLRDRLRDIEQHLVTFLRVITCRAQAEIDVVIPGYIHLQRAQPIRWSPWLLSYDTFLSTDLGRLRQVIKRVNKSPLGAGVIFGHPFGIDREAMAEELGFEGIINNSMAAVADRDFVVETLQWAATTMQHISRWAEKPDPVFDCRVRVREAGGCILHWEQSDAPKEESRFA
jgi:argininosuccinate lyase